MNKWSCNIMQQQNEGSRRRPGTPLMANFTLLMEKQTLHLCLLWNQSIRHSNVCLCSWYTKKLQSNSFTYLLFSCKTPLCCLWKHVGTVFYVSWLCSHIAHFLIEQLRHVSFLKQQFSRLKLFQSFLWVCLFTNF